MKALTVCQPYAELIVRLEKPIENREWATSHRGELAIHAGKSRDWLDEDDERRYPGMPFGAVVAVAHVVACLKRPFDGGPTSWGAWADLYEHEHANGPWCWVLERVVRLERPVPCSGAQGLWRLPDTVEAQVRRQLREVA